MKKVQIFLCFFFISITSFAQLDTIHWLPPMHGRLGPTWNAEHYIAISTPANNLVDYEISLPNGTVVNSGQVSNSSPVEFFVGNNNSNYLFADIPELNIPLQDKGLIVRVDEPAYVSYRSVTLFSGSPYQATTATAKGNVARGTEFRVGGIYNETGGTARSSFFSFLALHDSTQITVSDIAPGVEFQGSPPMNTTLINLTLNAGESAVYSVYNSSTPNLDGIVGALVQSTDDIVMMNGFYHGNVYGTSSQQDIGIDQSVPINLLGNRYVLIRGQGDDVYERPVIIAAYDQTDIFVNGATTPITTIDAGDYFMIPGSNYTSGDNMYVETSNPVYCYQHLLGISAPQTGGMNFIPPISCGMPSFVDLISSVDQIGAVSFNGGITAINGINDTLWVSDASGTTQYLPGSGDVVVGNSNWQTFKILNLSGDVRLTSTGGMAAGVFGGSNVAGFAGYYSGFGSYLESKFIIPDTLCASEVIQIDFTGVAPQTAQFQWDFNNAQIISGTGSGPYTVLWDQPGEFAVQLSLTADSCSEIFTDTITIIEDNLSPFDLGSDTIICAGESLLLSVPNGYPVVQWSTGSTGPSINIQNAGVYVVSSQTRCNSYTDTIEVEFLLPPEIPDVRDTVLCEGEYFSIELTPDSVIDGFTWYDGYTDEIRLIKNPGFYSYYAYNSCDTIQSNEFEVDFEYCDCSFYIPNAFTPDSNFKNDIFLPVTTCKIFEYKLDIYNRYGERIFETRNLLEGWNGTFDGQPAQHGLYLYKLKYRGMDDSGRVRQEQLTGSVFLIR